MLDLSECLEFAKQLALDSGAIGRKYFTHTIDFDNKSDNSPVTAADLEINQLVIDRCLAAYPDIGVVGEEQSRVGSSTDLLWVCDPIDGTIPYSLGMPISTFCLALVKDGVPVLGVVYDFNNDRLFSAIKDEGVWLNVERLELNAQVPMKLVCVEWWHSAPYNLSGVRERLTAKGYQVPNYSSGSFVNMMVALNRISGIVYAGDKAWDIAAAKVIVEELGGKVTDLDGKDQWYDQAIKGYISSNGSIHEAVVSIVRDL